MVDKVPYCLFPEQMFVVLFLQRIIGVKSPLPYCNNFDKKENNGGRTFFRANLSRGVGGLLYV